jgi:hypothetical protein
MRKIRTAVLYRQVATSASAWRAKEAFYFGATRLCGGVRHSNCEIRKGKTRSVQKFCMRGDSAGKPRLNPNFRGAPPEHQARPRGLSNTPRTGRILCA